MAATASRGGSNYAIQRVLGEGQYGVVHLGRKKKRPLSPYSTVPVKEEPSSSSSVAKAKKGTFDDDDLVAIKTIRNDKELGVNFTAIREVKLLRELSHDNICNLLDVYHNVEGDSLSLVYEFCGGGDVTDMKDSHPKKGSDPEKMATYFERAKYVAKTLLEVLQVSG